MHIKLLRHENFCLLFIKVTCVETDGLSKIKSTICNFLKTDLDFGVAYEILEKLPVDGHFYIFFQGN